MTAITSLPPEILILLIKSCQTSQSIASLARTCKSLYTSVTPLLYKRQLDTNDHHVTFYAAKHGILTTLQNVNRYMTLQVFECSKGNYHTGPFGSEKQRRNGWFWTPLHVAVKNGHVEIVRYLLDNGADINAPSLNFHDNVGITEGKYHLDFGDVVSFYVPPLVTFSPLITSIHHRHENITALLLSRGASIQINDVRELQPCGTTALHVAVVNANVSAVRMLIEGGYAGPNDLDADEFPPLLWAALHVCNDERVRLSMEVLVELGADLNHAMPNHPRLGPNHNMVSYLIKRGKVKAAQELINLGATSVIDLDSQS
ncbi:serine threonine phosphatase 6 regulatory ankyrin repeat subunit b [Fusarium heterosporum]|uniref:Serine threonine phosphatase 6 regulatory ankyrin repeat subunit b n=1 Tax=Fusarium heterosporum TaxID=42747 RepID=A0A8H5TSI8_FUSHE|nr:serine threonine phosphatase 6 regulatory ankyrin repeat subunit b [Fusarium heterosporum]